MKSITLCLAALSLSPVAVYGGTTFNLGIASPFAVFSGSAVTNTGATNVMGDVGVWPGNSVAGFPQGSITGNVHIADTMATKAFADASSAFTAAANNPCGTNLSGQNLGGATLTAGVYCFSSSAMLGGTLTLDAKGDPNAVFIIQTTYALTTGMGASVALANGAQGSNVLWEIGSSANIGAGSSLVGNILAQGNVNMNTGASLQCGSAISIGGAVNLDTNKVSVCGGLITDPIFTDPSGVPEPSTASLFLVVGIPGLLWMRKRQRSRTITKKSPEA